MISERPFKVVLNCTCVILKIPLNNSCQTFDAARHTTIQQMCQCAKYYTTSSEVFIIY